MKSAKKHTPSPAPPALTSAVAQYNRDGYYIARGLLPRARIDRILREIHQLAIRQLVLHRLPVCRGNTPPDILANLQTLFRFDQKIYLSTLTLGAKLTCLYELYLDKNIRAFAAALGHEVPFWQTGPVLHLMAPSLRIEGGYYGFATHQDWPSLQGSLNAVIAWTPLVDIDTSMHTMELIPRSHTKGLYPASDKQHILEVDPASYNPKDFIRVGAKRGDVVFFSSFTLHRSCDSGDERLRVAASIRYENAAEPHFIERGYPCAQKRWSSKELITPNFPTAEQLEKVFKP